MPTTIQVTIDCADPQVMTKFWTSALGYTLEPPPDGHVSWLAYWTSIGIPADEVDETEGDSIIDPQGLGPRIWFQLVPEPKKVKNRVHLDLDRTGGRSTPFDLRVQRVDDEVDRLVALGASHLRTLHTAGADYYGVVLQDPEGNEFCIH